MGLVGQWERIQATLPGDWADARLVLRAADVGAATRAAALLAPLAPGRRGREFLLEAVRHGSASSPLAVSRALARLDEAGIAADLDLVHADTAQAAGKGAPGDTLVDAWAAALARLPADWSDAYVELELTSTDHLDPAALALSPVNPARFGAVSGFRFRSARRFGYGASPGMVSRCLSRLDDQGIPGGLSVLWALSDTHPVGTQGPVWYVEGKVV